MILPLVQTLLALAIALHQPQLSFKSTSLDLNPADGISQIQPSGENIIAVGQHSYTVLTRDLKVVKTTEYPPPLESRLRTLTKVVLTMVDDRPVYGLELPIPHTGAEVGLIDFAAKTRKVFYTSPTSERENRVIAGWPIPDGAAVMTVGDMRTSDVIIVAMDGTERSRRVVPCPCNQDAIAGPRTLGQQRVVIYGVDGMVIVADERGVELRRWSTPEKDDYISTLTAGEEHNGQLVVDTTISRHSGQADWHWVYAALKLTATPGGLEFKGMEVPLEEARKVLGRAAPQHVTVDGMRYGVEMNVASSHRPGGGIGAKVPTVRVYDADGNKVAEHLPVTGEPPFIADSGVLWSDGLSPVLFVGWGATIYRIECSREAVAK